MDSQEEQLAAPKRMEALRPSLMVQREPIVRLAQPLEQEAGPDDFHLRQARQLTERNPTSPAAWARLAQAELISGNCDAAIGAALASLKSMETADGGAALAAAVVLVACDRAEAAENALQSVDVAQQDRSLSSVRTFRATLAAQRGDYKQALRLAAGIDTPESWSLQGWIKLRGRDYPAAIKCYRRALRAGNPDPEVLTNIGYAHAALGQRERAIRDTRYALSLRPANRSRVGLNLVTYYATEGDYDDALKVIRSLQEEAPRNLDLWFAQAHLHLSFGDPEAAQRTLRRIRTGLWAHLSVPQQAELTANLAFVGWRLGKQTQKEAAREILGVLKQVDFSTPRLAEMLPPLLDRFSDAKALRETLVRVRQANPDSPTHYLDVHLAVLERRFDDATSTSVAWVKAEPLSSAAAVAATYLLTNVAGAPDAAVDIGLASLRRMPAADMLANNVAYALALAGRADEAVSLVPEDHSAQCAATSGLIALCLGDHERAISSYRAAFDRARKTGDPCLEALVVLHAKMAVHRFGGGLAEVDLGLPELVFSGEWYDQPRFEISVRMLKRLGVESPTVQ